MTRAVMDAVQMLACGGGAEERWQAAIRLAELVGSGAILVAKVDPASGEILWVNTNLSSDWMEEYIHEGYAEVDPVLNGLSGTTNVMTIHAGVSKRDEETDLRAYNLNHGLHAAGIGSMHSLRFGAEGQPTTFVTLAAAGSASQMQADSPMDISVLATLMVFAVDRPVDNLSNRLIGFPKLSARQRDVLSLLAHGYQTTQIADKLGLSDAAINKHFAAARAKLGAATREQALRSHWAAD